MESSPAEMKNDHQIHNSPSRTANGGGDSPASSASSLTTLTNFDSPAQEYSSNLDYATEQGMIESQYNYGTVVAPSDCYPSYRDTTAEAAGLMPSSWSSVNPTLNTMPMQAMSVDMGMIPATTTFMNQRPTFMDIVPQHHPHHPHYHHYPVQPTKPKRRRVITTQQRKAANIRERRRMFNINEGFDELRKKVPTFAYERRLSRIETLRLAIVYIGFMTDIVNGKDAKDVQLRQKLFFKDHPEMKENECIDTDSSLPSPDISTLMAC
ncbi:uncharacterized protein LOC144434029 [Glandiceps talaboti]